MGGAFSNLCPLIPISDKYGGQVKNRKKGMNLKSFLSETVVQILTKLCWNDTRVFYFQNSVRHLIPTPDQADRHTRT